MNVKRFVGRTAREAMRKVSGELGPDALVLANRPCAEGVEILAAAPEAVEGALPQEGALFAAANAPASDDHDEPHADGYWNRDMAASAQAAVGGKALPPMSTVSFQDYVRQRLRDRSRESAREGAPLDTPFAEPQAHGVVQRSAAAPADGARKAHIASPRAAITRPTPVAAPQPAASPSPAARPIDTPAPAASAAPFDFDFGAPVRAPAAARAEAVRAPAPQALASEALVAELQTLKRMISSQFESMRWFDEVARSPIQAQLLRTLVEAGFSLKLARSVVTRLPADYAARQASQWLHKVLARNLRCVPQSDTFEAGGAFALIGPTGVGKTTTTAKIAAQQVLRHGPQSVSLITVDTYRLGAHDQLRAFGRILNVPVHVAHDAAALGDLLRRRDPRQLMLIDTVGMGHRDERIGSLLTMLPRDSVQHVVVASSAAQAESIDESLRAYEAKDAAGVILTKLDEAARLGGAIDCLVRHRLPLLGICDGQRVPEDWQQPDAQSLLQRALNAGRAGAFGLSDESLPTLLGVAATAQGSDLHA